MPEANWHIFPVEKPPKDGLYLVKVDFGYGEYIYEWVWEKGDFHNGVFCELSNIVHAWAEVPAPESEPEPMPTDSTVRWHPFPKEAPTKAGRYMVTLVDAIRLRKGTLVTFDYWSPMAYRWSIYTADGIAAWAEEPEPYEEMWKGDEHV